MAFDFKVKSPAKPKLFRGDLWNDMWKPAGLNPVRMVPHEYEVIHFMGRPELELHKLGYWVKSGSLGSVQQ